MAAGPSISSRGEPAWDVARLFPNQGDWGEADYLALDTNHFVELVDGCVEVHRMPTMTHQAILGFVAMRLRDFVSEQNLGEALISPLPVRLRPGLYREPDVIFVLREHADRLKEAYCDGADLVIEVVSDDAEGRKRDYETKRREYADAGVNEYWIVDPQTQRILVLRLDSCRYEAYGEFAGTTPATSSLLGGFQVTPYAAFAAGRRE